MNKVILTGNLTKDPDLRYTQSGTGVASFTLAVNRRYSNQNGDKEADFINCVAWQKTAEFVANYFKKGQMMALEGRLQVRSYEGNDGQKKWVTEVIAESIEFCGGSGGVAKGSAGSKPSNVGTGSLDSFLAGEEINFSDQDIPF